MPVKSPMRCILGLRKSVLNWERAKLMIPIFLVFWVVFVGVTGASYARESDCVLFSAAGECPIGWTWSDISKILLLSLSMNSSLT